MKGTIKLVVAAIVGGAVSFGLFKLTEELPKPYATEENGTVKQTGPFDSSSPRFASLLPAEAANFDFRKAAKTSIDAVVHVKTIYESKTRVYTDPFMEFFFGHGTMQQKIPRREGMGSGVIISQDGFVVTNNHVVNGADQLEVTLNDRKQYTADVIGTDPTTDLALLKINGKNLPAIQYGNSDNLDVGEWVLAVGNPFNLRSTVTAGIVSAKGRDINILDRNQENGLPPIESFIQTDAAVNPGNSGGALVNVNGELVGINTAIQTNTGSYTGYSFAVPVNIVKKVVHDILEYGMVQRAFIGVSIRPIDKDLAEQENLNDLNGVYVAGLAEKGAAEEAGIQSGDVITKIGAVQVDNIPELQEQLGKFRPGDNILVTVKRNGEEIEVPITLKNRYGNTEVVSKKKDNLVNSLGVQLETVDTDEKNKLNIHGGLKVIKMMPGKLQRAGIDEGFIITHVDEEEVKSYEGFVKTLENKKGGVLIEGIYPNGIKAYYGLGM